MAAKNNAVYCPEHGDVSKKVKNQYLVADDIPVCGVPVDGRHATVANHDNPGTYWETHQRCMLPLSETEEGAAQWKKDEEKRVADEEAARDKRIASEK